MPKTNKAPKAKPPLVALNMPPELLARIDAEAKRLERPRAWIIRKAIERGLDCKPSSSLAHSNTDHD